MSQKWHKIETQSPWKANRNYYGFYQMVVNSMTEWPAATPNHSVFYTVCCISFITDTDISNCYKVNTVVLWHCWLGVRKSIRPVKNWVMGYWRGVWCKWFVYGPADATATHHLLLQ